MQLNPYGLTNVGAQSAPALVDLDADGLLDLVVGRSNGDLVVFQNGGTPTAPSFAAPVVNPFGLQNSFGYSIPTFGDVDSDGDVDALVGNGAGTTFFQENIASTPTPTVTVTPTPTATETPTPTVEPTPGAGVGALPVAAKAVDVSLVQAFPECGSYGFSPDTDLQGSPACMHSLSPFPSYGTYHRLDGSPPEGWRWNPNKGKGRVTLTPTTKVQQNPLNPAGNTVDVVVKVSLQGVVDSFGPANDSGELQIGFRPMLNDRVAGPLTLAEGMTGDLFVPVPLPVIGGKGKVKTSINAIFTPNPGLPPSGQLAITSIGVFDADSNLFAEPGVELPILPGNYALAGRGCPFDRPKKASKATLSFVQAFAACDRSYCDPWTFECFFPPVCGYGLDDDMPPNTTSEYGPACLAYTCNELAGSPADGWRWDPATGMGSLSGMSRSLLNGRERRLG